MLRRFCWPIELLAKRISGVRQRHFIKSIAQIMLTCHTWENRCIIRWFAEFSLRVQPWIAQAHCQDKQNVYGIKRASSRSIAEYNVCWQYHIAFAEWLRFDLHVLLRLIRKLRYYGWMICVAIALDCLFKARGDDHGGTLHNPLVLFSFFFALSIEHASRNGILLFSFLLRRAKIDKCETDGMNDALLSNWPFTARRSEIAVQCVGNPSTFAFIFPSQFVFRRLLGRAP